MARPPLALGHHGTVKLTREGNQWVARCRVRDLDGATRRVARWGSTRTAAQQALQEELRGRHGECTEVLRPNSRFRDAATLYMGKIAARREDSTADAYTYWLDKLVLPQLGELRLAGCDVAQMDAFFTRLERGRRVVEHENGNDLGKAALRRQHPAHPPLHRHRRAATGRSPQGHPGEPGPRARTHRVTEGPPQGTPRGLNAEERRRLLAYVDTDKTAVRADMPDLILFALGSGLRIGEICAVRWRDLDLDGIPVVSDSDMRLVPVVAVRQNVYPVKGKGLAVHGGKSTADVDSRMIPTFRRAFPSAGSRRRGVSDQRCNRS